MSYRHTPPLHHSSSSPAPQMNDPAFYLTGSWISLSLPRYNHEKFCKSILFGCNGFSKIKREYTDLKIKAYALYFNSTSIAKEKSHDCNHNV